MNKLSLTKALVCFFSVLILPACSALNTQFHGMTTQITPVQKVDKSAPMTTPIVTEELAKKGLSYQPDARDKMYADNDEGQRRWHDPLISGFHPERTHKSLTDYASQIAMQLLDSARELDAKHLIGIASFVRLNTSLQETTVLGNQLSELLIAQMQSYGLGVVDFKMAGDIIVTPKGDLAMRRSNGREAKKLAMDHILTGTLIEEPRGVRINARIVSTANYQVVASTSLLIPAFIVTQLNHAMVGSTASTPVTVGF